MPECTSTGVCGVTSRRSHPETAIIYFKIQAVSITAEHKFDSRAYARGRQDYDA
jgi:hypothetical protein